MLCICQSLYCLSNMVLLLCFLLLCYFYIRGRINIFYDENDILDNYDQALFSLCLISCLVISIELVYPHLSIQLIDRLLMLLYQMLLLLVMMKIHEISINKIVIAMIIVWLGATAFAAYGTILVIQIYADNREQDVQKLVFLLYPFCLKSPLLAAYILAFLTLNRYDQPKNNAQCNQQHRVIFAQWRSGLRKIVYTEIKRRKVYVKVLIFSSFIASTFLVIVDWQQITKTVCCSEQSLFLAEMLGNVFAFLIINGIQPLSVYYLMIWRNSKYLSKKAKEEQFRKSNAAMIELESYQRIT